MPGKENNGIVERLTDGTGSQEAQPAGTGFADMIKKKVKPQYEMNQEFFGYI